MKCNDTDVKFLPTLATSCCVIHICEFKVVSLMRMGLYQE